MNKILVFSDLHGDIDSLALLLKRVREEHVDCMLCAGDLGLDRLGMHRESLRSLTIPFFVVRGNCDSPWVFAETGFIVPTRYYMEHLGERTICMTHGDVIQDWKAFPFPMDERDIFISGHTHVALLDKKRGSPIMLNPGSASSPRNNRAPSYAIVENHNISIKEIRTGRIMKKLLITE